MRADTAKAASRVQPVLHNEACRRRNRARALHLSRHHCEAAWWLNRGRYTAWRVHRNHGDFAACVCGTFLNACSRPDFRLWPKADIPSCTAHVRFWGVKRTSSLSIDDYAAPMQIGRVEDRSNSVRSPSCYRWIFTSLVGALAKEEVAN